jgi:hypothetical protein
MKKLALEELSNKVALSAVPLKLVAYTLAHFSVEEPKVRVLLALGIIL